MTAPAYRKRHQRSGICGCHGTAPPPTGGWRRRRLRVRWHGRAAGQPSGQASSRVSPGPVPIGPHPRRIRRFPRNGAVRHDLLSPGIRPRQRPWRTRPPLPPPPGRLPGFRPADRLPPDRARFPQRDLSLPPSLLPALPAPCPSRMRHPGRIRTRFPCADLRRAGMRRRVAAVAAPVAARRPAVPRWAGAVWQAGTVALWEGRNVRRQPSRHRHRGRPLPSGRVATARYLVTPRPVTPHRGHHPVAQPRRSRGEPVPPPHPLCPVCRAHRSGNRP
jgi:hypothetical protein